MKTAIYAFIFAGVFAIGSLIAAPKTETQTSTPSADCTCKKCSECCGSECSCSMSCCSK